jgi:hypothetical protein
VKDPAERESITVVEYISAGGFAIVPYIIMPCKVFKEKMFNNNLPDGTKIAQSETGYTDDELAIEWLWHFHKQTRGRQQGRYRLLIFDGHGSHMTFEFVSICDQLDIIPFCLLAHSTHFCQPLDVGCFLQEKHWHKRSIEERVRSGRNNFTKATFLQVLTQIRARTFTPWNIKSSFRKAGIYPLDPEPVLTAMKLRAEKKMGDKDIKGRIYYHDQSNPEEGIRIPASNERLPRLQTPERSIWEEQPGESPEPPIDPDDWNDYLEGDIELPPLPPLPVIDSDMTDELVEPFSETNLTDYGEENSGIEGLDPRWYAKTQFMSTPYGAKGIFAHSEFLEKNEDIMSSPSRRLSNRKFRKGAQIEANLGAIAKRQLLEKDEFDIWSSNSPFVNETHHERYVKVPNGGRVITVSNALRSIKARDEKDEEDELSKAQREMEHA